MASTTTYASFGSVYGNTKEKMATIEAALNLGGLAVAYNDDEQSGTIILPTVYEDVNNLISGTPAPEAIAEPVTLETETDDSTDTESETDE